MKNNKKYLVFILWYSKSMANFVAFHWNISSSINLLFLKSELWITSTFFYTELMRNVGLFFVNQFFKPKLGIMPNSTAVLVLVLYRGNLGLFWNLLLILRILTYIYIFFQEEGWLMGYKDATGQKGMFPANFTRPI